MSLFDSWDYLIVTASNEPQARGYERQLAARQDLMPRANVRHVKVIADPQGQRIGSGGSTVHCLMRILSWELAARPSTMDAPDAWCHALGRLRILILHAGGDSRRLPAYGPCGKVFVPIPGDSDSVVPPTLFDRQLPCYLQLPPTPDGAGQVVLAAGDVSLSFDPQEVDLAAAGLTGIACHGSPEHGARHGVLCVGEASQVQRFLQKPSTQVQEAMGAVDRYGRVLLDTGIFSFDAQLATLLLRLFGAQPGSEAKLVPSGAVGEAAFAHGLDFYRDLCCAMGTATTLEDFCEAALSAGSRLGRGVLETLFESLHGVPFRAQVLPHCQFRHFGTTQQLLTSGTQLLDEEQGNFATPPQLTINTEIAGGGKVEGASAWIEACRIQAPLRLAGNNVVTGIDVREEISLPAGACLDVHSGADRSGKSVSFCRLYGIGDSFCARLSEGASFCGRPLAQWLEQMGAAIEEIWEPDDRLSASAWTARLFPAGDDSNQLSQWLWTYDPQTASDDQRRAWRGADRYSLADIALLSDHDAFHKRRNAIRARAVLSNLRWMFRRDSGMSAADLAQALGHADHLGIAVAQILAEAHWWLGNGTEIRSMSALLAGRILHTLGSALCQLDNGSAANLEQTVPGLGIALSDEQHAWLASLQLTVSPETLLAPWTESLQNVAFDTVRKAIVGREIEGLEHCSSAPASPARESLTHAWRPEPNGSLASGHPTNALRPDEIVWGRSPARLDLGGGWTDTPPYSLENGGCVVNAAVDLNGQPPIQAYARVTREPIVRIASIDLGKQVTIGELDQLFDFRSAVSEFSLVKAALVLAGFCPQGGRWPDCRSLRHMLQSFGGGLDITTFSAIPRGSGLGTSSIMGAVILSVIHRVLGTTLAWRDLFHGVLQLEQALTTGGGWQDQVGGALEGVKLITTEPGLVPDPRIHFLPDTLLAAPERAGSVLLYYTGITRLAKNILRTVVARYLDRDRLAMQTLRRLHALPPHIADALSRKNLAAFGRGIEVAWQLNKQLDPAATTQEIEGLLHRIADHLEGAKLLGAGGGGFLLLVAKSPEDARSIRQLLEDEPLNAKARFFDFQVSQEGLAVSVC